jgi:branched-chain amino acid transport system substrate-binding protein
VSKEIHKAGGVFMTPVGADEITGKDCNASTFRWSVPTYGAIRETLVPMIRQLPQAKRWYTITPQYVFGDALLDNAARCSPSSAWNTSATATTRCRSRNSPAT